MKYLQAVAHALMVLSFSSRASAATCEDTNGAAVGPYFNGCELYVTMPDFCGESDDDFDSATMCCTCGGGQITGAGSVDDGTDDDGTADTTGCDTTTETSGDANKYGLTFSATGCCNTAPDTSAWESQSDTQVWSNMHTMCLKNQQGTATAHQRSKCGCCTDHVYDCTQQTEYTTSPAEPTISYDWEATQWGECTEGCGGGSQHRSVSCVSSMGGAVSDSHCTDTKPTTSQQCNSQACEDNGPFFWGEPGAWGECHCEWGTQTRLVECGSYSGGTASASRCPASKPATVQSCDARQISDSCLQNKPGWGAEYTCEGSVLRCEGEHAADMRECCPGTCDTCPPEDKGSTILHLSLSLEGSFADQPDLASIDQEALRVELARLLLVNEDRVVITSIEDQQGVVVTFLVLLLGSLETAQSRVLDASGSTITVTGGSYSYSLEVTPLTPPPTSTPPRQPYQQGTTTKYTYQYAGAATATNSVAVKEGPGWWVAAVLLLFFFMVLAVVVVSELYCPDRAGHKYGFNRDYKSGVQLLKSDAAHKLHDVEAQLKDFKASHTQPSTPQFQNAPPLPSAPKPPALPGQPPQAQPPQTAVPQPSTPGQAGGKDHSMMSGWFTNKKTDTAIATTTAPPLPPPTQPKPPLPATGNGGQEPTADMAMLPPHPTPSFKTPPPLPSQPPPPPLPAAQPPAVPPSQPPAPPMLA